MNKPRIQEWIQILESGKYRWCPEIAYNPNRDAHCPIGMAATEWGFDWSKSPTLFREYLFVREKTGLSTEQLTKVWEINDSCFRKEIAIPRVVEYLKSLLEE